MKKNGRNTHDLAAFEQAHGGRKIEALKRSLEAERKKVDALADVQGKLTIIKELGNTVRFGLIGDIHVGSLYFHEAALSAFYQYAAKCGVSEFFVCGDVLDGHRMYKGQEFEVRDIGLEAQLERAARSLPQIEQTRFITGNHDQSFKTLAGVPVGKLLQDAVPSWTFIGEEQGRVQFDTEEGSFVLSLIHPGGGTAYAVSYRPQQIVTALEGGTKPNMVGIGHFHKADMMPSYRNVAAVSVGTFQRQTPYMARKAIAAHVGGWIIEVAVGADYNAIRGEFVAVYK